MVPLLIIIGVVVVLGLILVGMYNGLVKLRNAVDGAWAQIDVQLKRRYDLIPNLVETVKGYAAHERETLEAVIAARNVAVNAHGPGEQAAADNMLTGTLKSLFALSEAYPDLKANQNFLELQAQLAETENQISFARQYYNDAVATLNKLTQTIPWMFFTGVAGVHKREFYDAPDGQEQAPQVKF